MIEHSRAISCPSARYFLAGTKKVQQELARPGVLGRFIQDESIIQQLQATFAGQFSLDQVIRHLLTGKIYKIAKLSQFYYNNASLQGEEGDENIRKGMENPEKFVLKPQREGGGKYILFLSQKLFTFSVKTLKTFVTCRKQYFWGGDTQEAGGDMANKGEECLHFDGEDFASCHRELWHLGRPACHQAQYGQRTWCIWHSCWVGS